MFIIARVRTRGDPNASKYIGNNGASVIFDALAVFLARGWIDDAIQAEFTRKQNTTVTTPKKVETNTVPVLVLERDVSFGTALTPDDVRVVQYPEGIAAEGTYGSANQLFIDLNQQTTVLIRMNKNEPVLGYKVSGPGMAGTMSALISDGMRATSIMT